MMLEELAIELEPDTGRRIAWADRESGYLDILSNHSCAGEGYIRGGCRRLRDVCAVDGGVAIDRSKATTRVIPGEIRHDNLEIALLMEKGAFWASLRHAASLHDPVSRQGFGQESSPVSRHGSSEDNGLAFVLPACRKPWKTDMRFVPRAAAQGATSRNEPEVGRLPAGLEVWVACRDADPEHGIPEALAIASSEPFTMGRLHHHAGLRIPKGESIAFVHVQSASPSQDTHLGTAPADDGSCFDCYVAWGSNTEEAAGKAALLASSRAIESHRAGIETFLSGAGFRSGDAYFDKAAAWAAFSGWSLVTQEYGPGIWAGLPWFRDNWGRDTFIALPGILLASGRFAEARDIIENFARRQEMDERSPNFGRIPNRWRNPDDVIYNTADGTPWFVREVWDYAQYSGDRGFVVDMAPCVFRALDADLGRCDTSGFLKHSHADTWMDARIHGNEPWSPRGDRAVEVQALLYTALLCGARIAAIAGQPDKAQRYRQEATRLRSSFLERFWSVEHGRLADRLLPDAADGTPGRADHRSRPNSLMAITVPSILSDDEALLPPDIEAAALADCSGELVYPHGVASLSQEDPFFHGRHDNQAMYHKDAAYHNGTIWLWNSGFAISAMLKSGFVETAWRLHRELARQVLETGAVGTLSENLDALPGPDGEVVPTGTFSQAWSVSEFTRNVSEDWLGFRPRLMDNTIVSAPRLPASWSELTASRRLGKGDRLDMRFRREGDLVRYEFTLAGNPTKPAEDDSALSLLLELPGPHGMIRSTYPLRYGVPVVHTHDSLPGESAEVTKPDDCPGSTKPDALRLAEPRLTPWNGAVSKKDFLQTIILSGKHDAGPVNSLAAWFNSDDFARLYHTDEELGALWSREHTEFRLWAPTSTRVSLSLWRRGDGGEQLSTVDLSQRARGVWKVTVPGDLHGVYYTFRVHTYGLTCETIDPYARSAGLNGMRGMVLDPDRAAPEGWQDFKAPACASPNDAIVYEAHIRDLTSSPAWPGDAATEPGHTAAISRSEGPGKLRCTYRGFVHPGTKSCAVPTGFDHIRSLGVTHIQLLPVFDFVSVDESRVGDADYQSRREHGAFNWGYDPGNYAVPEGSYSSDPRDGQCRVSELRELVKACAEAGMGIVMDVVYNHVPDAQKSALEACVPGYYFRDRRDSGAGDDTASERYMFARYMSDTLAWWLAAYKLSGFRFDLMGLHDVATMNAIADRLRAIKPDVLLYGEGWDMYRGGNAGMEPALMEHALMEPASQRNIRKLHGYGMFNDAFRDGVKGSAFDAASPGWIHDGRMVESVKFGMAGAVAHPQIRNHAVSGTAFPRPWTELSSSSVNYVEVHDNLTLRDKLELVEPGRDTAWYARMQRLALTLVLVSQGMPVLHAGMEFLRSKRFPDAWLADSLPDKSVSLPDGSKTFCHDSYKFGDALNGLDWDEAARNSATVQYVRGLMALRKSLPLLRLRTGPEIRRNLHFVADRHGLLAWSLGPAIQGRLVIAANANSDAVDFRLPRGKHGGTWKVLADSSSAFAQSYDNPLLHASVELPAKGALLLERID